jgi:hypothetical protein
MKKLLMSSICIIYIFCLTSCIVPTTTTISGSDTSNGNAAMEELLSQIEALKTDLASLKDTAQTTQSALEKKILDNHGVILNALDNENGDDIYLGMDREGDNISAVYIKVPVAGEGEPDIDQFMLITGYESNGVLFFNTLVVPQYSITDDQYEKYGVDKNQSHIIKLMTSNMKYDDTSTMLIIFIDSKGNEYSQYVASVHFSSDI